VAAIFPEQIQCFTVALKNNLFINFFRKTDSAVCRNIIINSHIPAKMNQQEGIGAGTVSGLCAGYTIQSFWKHEQEHDGKKMFDEFIRNWCRWMHLDSWK
jgi:hypothetical protein